MYPYWATFTCNIFVIFHSSASIVWKTPVIRGQSKSVSFSHFWQEHLHSFVQGAHVQDEQLFLHLYLSGGFSGGSVDHKIFWRFWPTNYSMLNSTWVFCTKQTLVPLVVTRAVNSPGWTVQRARARAGPGSQDILNLPSKFSQMMLFLHKNWLIPNDFSRGALWLAN